MPAKTGLLAVAEELSPIPCLLPTGMRQELSDSPAETPGPIRAKAKPVMPRLYHLTPGLLKRGSFNPMLGIDQDLPSHRTSSSKRLGHFGFRVKADGWYVTRRSEWPSK